MAAQANVTSLGRADRLAVGRNTLILLATNFSSAAFGLVISMLIARAAGDAALGVYSLALAWSLTLAQFADLGMNTLLTRDLARQPQDTAMYVHASLVAKAIIAGVLTAALLALAPALTQSAVAARALQIGAALIGLNAFYGTFTAVFRAFGRMMPILGLNMSGLAIQTLATGWLLWRGAGVERLVLLAVVVQLIQLGGALTVYRLAYASLPTAARLDVQSVLRLVRAGLPFAIAGILASLEMRANIFLLGAIEGERAVGWYAAAARLTEGLKLAPNAFFGAMLPALAALSAARGETRLHSFFRRGEWALIAFGGAAAILLTLSAPRLISLVYGDAFSSAVPALIVLAWGLIPALVSGLLVLYLYARGDEDSVNWLLGIALAVQVLAAWVLIRGYGATGAAAAALVSDIGLWFLLRRRIAQLDRGERGDWRLLARASAPPLVLFALALVMRLAPVVHNTFDGLYGQDAYAYYGYARELFDALRTLHFPPPFWWALGYPLLLDLGFVVGGVNPSSAQAITLLCGALVAPCAYALAREAAPSEYAHTAGWIAGLVCAMGGQLVQSSVVIMADAPALLFATIGAWLLLRYARTRRFGTLCVASFAVGLAVWMRWQNLIFAGAWLAAVAVIEFRARHLLTQSAARWLAAAVIVTLVLLPQLWIRATTNAPFAGQNWLQEWRVENFLARTFDNADGHFEYALPVAIFYAQVLAHPAYLCALLTPLFLAGVVVLLGQASVTPRAAALLLGGWIGGMLLFLAGIPYENFRFGLGLFVPVAVFSGLGAGWLWHKWNAPRWRFALAGWMGVALLIMLLWQPRVLAPVLERKARELAQMRWLQARLLPNALVYTMGINGAVETYSDLYAPSLWSLDPAALQPDIPTYLYVDTNNIDRQWRGRFPDQLVRGLNETNSLHPLASFEGWTLYRVRDCKYRVLDCE